MSPAGRSEVAARVSPARETAYVVVRRVFEQGAYADRALIAEAAHLDSRERALATALSYATVQRRATLDHILAQLSNRPLQRVQPGVLAALRLGLTQLVLLDGIADHAAVHESVELAKRDVPGAGGFANAILRRATREGRGILAGLSDETPAGAAIRHSVPEWLAQLWFDELGAAEARELLAAMNQPAESALRVNTLVATAAQVAAELPVPSRPAVGLAEGLVLDGAFDAHGSELFHRGAIMPQSRGSMLPVQLLDPQPGEAILDLCAAPGAKTGQIAARMEDSGELVAVERHSGRARALERTLERQQIRCARVVVGDAARPDVRDGPTRTFDRVLVDPPCSGLGTLRSRPDLRWRTSRERVQALPAIQRQILDAGARVVRVGGAIVYSVCTISRSESEAVIDGFLAAHDDFTLAAQDEAVHRVLPHRDGTDGFFLAHLRRC